MFSQASVILFTEGDLADPPGQTPPWVAPLGRNTPPDRHPTGQTHLLPSMATASDGMHHSGMHSC